MQFTYDDYQEMRESSSGACTQCGEFREMCEPDADGYHCEACGANAVQGCDNLLAMDLIDDPEDDPQPFEADATTAAMIGDDPGLMLGRMMIRLIVSRSIKCDRCGAILDQHTASHLRLVAEHQPRKGGTILCGECFPKCEPVLPKLAQDLGGSGWALTRWADGESFIPAAGGDV